MSSSDAEPGYRCVLTGDRLFGALHPHELVEDGLAYCVRGSMDAGIDALAMEGGPLPRDGALPLSVVDVVRWAGLRPVELDRPGFVKLWQRYVAALQAHLEASGPEGVEAADELLLRAHLFARALMQRFDELDFLLGASEDARGPLAVLHYKEDGLIPHIYYLAAGAVKAGGPRGSST
jgi:hypothetical protein